MFLDGSRKKRKNQEGKTPGRLGSHLKQPVDRVLGISGGGDDSQWALLRGRVWNGKNEAQWGFPLNTGSKS